MVEVSGVDPARGTFVLKCADCAPLTGEMLPDGDIGIAFAHACAHKIGYTNAPTSPMSLTERRVVVVITEAAVNGQDSAEHWTTRAWCRSVEPDALFVEGKAQQRAKRICRNCDVVVECLAEALDQKIEFGVWGGMTERERRKMLRLHPEVASWKRVFDDSTHLPRAAGQ